MENILKLSTTEKICLLNEIRKNYSYYKKQWTTEKVDFLHESVIREVQNLGVFTL